MIKVITENATHYYYEEGDVVRQLSTNREFKVKSIDKEKKEITTVTGQVIALSPDIKPTDVTLRSSQVVDKKKKSLDLKIKYHDANMPTLTKLDKGDWIDVRAVSAKINGKPVEWDDDNSIEYKQGDFILVGVGFSMQLPEGYEAYVVPRSSTFKNYGFIQTNSEGIIDESYSGNNDQWFVPFYALKDGQLVKYDRIAQFRIARKMPSLNFVTVDSLDNEDRNGFGSTGVK